MDIVYTYGGGPFIEWAFNIVASVVNQEEYKSVITMGALIGLLWILLKNTIRINWGDSAKTMMIAVSAYYLMFIPKINVAIHDVLDYGQIRQVDNVPWVLGRLASATSSFGYHQGKLVEQFAALPEDQQYQKYGLLFGSDLIRISNQAVIQDPMLRQNTEEFMRECLVNAIMMGQYSQSEITNSSNLFTLLESTMKNTLDVMDWKIPRATNGYDYVKMNCGEAFENIKDGIIQDQPKIEQWISNKLKSINFVTSSLSSNDNIDLTPTIKSQLASQSSYFMGLADSSRNLLFHNVIRNATQDGIASTDPSNYSKASSSLQSSNMMQIAGEMAKTTVVLWRIFFEILLYVGYLLIIPLMLILGAEQRFLNYCKKLLELQLWIPLYAILNGLLTKAQQLKLKNFEYEGSTIANTSAMNDALSQLSLLAGFGVVMIPFLAKMLMNGFDSLTHLAGTMLSPLMQTAHSTASEMTSGNFNFGNTSMGNSSYNNVNSNKTDIADIHRDEDGMSTFTNQEGTKFYDGSLNENKFADFNLSYGKNISSSLNNQHESYLTQGESMKNSSIESKNAAWSELSESAQHYSNSVNSGESWTKDVSQEQQDIYRTTNSINASVSANTSAGFKLFGNGVDLQGSVGMEAQAQAEDSLYKINRLSKSGSLTSSNEQLNSLNESATSHYNESVEQQKTSEEYFENASRISTLKQNISSSDVAHSQSLNNEFVDHLRSKGIWERDIQSLSANSHSNESQELIKEFINHKTDKLLDPLNIDMMEGKMVQQFSNNNDRFNQNNAVENKLTDNEKLIANRSVDINKNITSDVTSDVENGFKEVNNNLNIDKKMPEISKGGSEWRNIKN